MRPRFARESRMFLFHSQQGCEGSRNPEDSGKDQPADGWLPEGSIQKNLSALCAGLRPQIFLLASLPSVQSSGSAVSASLF